MQNRERIFKSFLFLMFGNIIIVILGNIYFGYFAFEIITLLSIFAIIMWLIITIQFDKFLEQRELRKRG